MSLLEYDQLHSSQGHRLTRSLFRETCKPGDTPVMTLGRKPYKGLLQLSPIFIELVTDDPSEYVFAEHVFGSFAHWKLVSESTWMQPYLEEWRMECDVRRKSTAFRQLYNDVLEGGRSASTSAKYLIEEGWKDKRSKETKKKVQTTASKASEGFAEDFLRLKEHMK